MMKMMMIEAATATVAAAAQKDDDYDERKSEWREEKNLAVEAINRRSIDFVACVCVFVRSALVTF